jgi:hypothetical protein
MKFLVLSSFLFLTSCGFFNRAGSNLTGKPAEICVNNVLYYQFSTGSTVAYDTTGTIKLCE